MDAPTEKDYSPRIIHDPFLDREIKRARVFLGQGNTGRSLKVIEALLQQEKYKETLEAWLQLTLITCRNSDQAACGKALTKAKELCKSKEDQAEIFYYAAIIERLRAEPDWKKVREFLVKAEELRPNDGRILQSLGYVLWTLKDREGAIEKSKRALDDPAIPDPVIAIHAINNLAYFLCEEAAEGHAKEKNLTKALELSEHLPAYQRVFRRRSSSWLHTRGWALLLRTQHLIDNKALTKDVKAALQEALQVLTLAEKVDKMNEYVKKHLAEAREMEHKIG